MTLYLEAQRKLLEDRELFEFLLDTGLYIEYLETIATLSTLYEEYLHQNYDYLITYLPKLDLIRYFIVNFLTEYMVYTDHDPSKIEDVIAAVNSFIALIMREIDRIHNDISKAKDVSARILKKRILTLIGELLEFYRVCLLKSPEEAIKFILIKRRYIKELLSAASSKAEKLKALEKEFEVVEETPSVEIPKETKPKKKVEISVPKELRKELEQEVMKKEASIAEGQKSIFTDEEIRLLIALIELGAVNNKMVPKEYLMARLNVSDYNKLVKIARDINVKADLHFKTPIIYIGDYAMSILQTFDKILDKLEDYHPMLVQIYKVKKEELKRLSEEEKEDSF